MAVKLQKFQTVSFSGWASPITKYNHIGTLAVQAPNVVSNLMTRVLARNFGQSLDSELNRFETRLFEDDTEFFWEVLGSARRNVALVAAYRLDGSQVKKGDPMVGANREQFYLEFNEAYFFKGEEIMGNLNQVYPLRIVADPISIGTKYRYLVETANGSTKGVPADRLLTGEKFSYTFAPIERGLSKEVGGVRHTTPMRMRNEFTMIRLHDAVSGDVYGKKIAIGIDLTYRDAAGKQQKSNFAWMHYWDYTFSQTWSEYKNNAYYYSVSNRNENGEYMNFGVSGEVIKKGDGIRVQLDRGNVIYYNDFSLKLMTEALLRISSAKIELGAGRHFTLHTGERGATLFHEAVRNTMSGWTEFTYNGDALGVVKKVSSPMHETSLSAGYQFTRFAGPMGIVLDVVIDSLKDDPVTNKLLTDDGFLASSAQFDIYDMGTAAEPNVFRCGIKGEPIEARSYQWGFRNPYTGQWGNPNMSYSDDRADVHVAGTFGACVKDPTRVFSMIPAVLAA